MEGGVHFITSRILMVDLLQERVPVKNVAGIIVYRAHQCVNFLIGFKIKIILNFYNIISRMEYLSQSFQVAKWISRIIHSSFVSRKKDRWFC